MYVQLHTYVCTYNMHVCVYSGAEGYMHVYMYLALSYAHSVHVHVHVCIYALLVHRAVAMLTY